MSSPVRLASRAFDKVWGTPQTEPWYEHGGDIKYGEVWFEEARTTPLLIKFIFTSESLSIQVHPNDAYAAKRHNSLGKTEMWHILRADKGAKIAAGVKREITRDELAEAISNDKILDLLNWVDVKAGDTFFVPAGTIHALGGGLALCEIQQHSDITYRLYDYGRPRELHIEDGLNVSLLAPCECKRDPLRIDTARELLAECEYFRTERLTVSGSMPCEPGHVYIALEGNGRIGREGFRPGEAFRVEEAGLQIESQGAVFASTTAPRI